MNKPGFCTCLGHQLISAFLLVTSKIIAACIGEYQYPISFETNSRMSLIKLANISIVSFSKYLLSLKVTKILKTVSNNPGSKMDSI